MNSELTAKMARRSEDCRVFALNGNNEMKDHVIERRILLPIRQKEAWDFFSTPMNLARITPEDMRFEILTEHPERPIFSGMHITYRVRPLFRVPMTWRTEIREVEAPFAFTDAQINGPFAKWEHEHSFVGTPHGIRVVDRVVYRLPFGMLGRLMHTLVVKSRVEAIFDHREKVLRAIFALK
ncbi:MAG: SRPBCC family protein [Flavobacteriales bacterium]|nr:SRPBCC family protein [Flavobacteriales bacterium]